MDTRLTMTVWLWALLIASVGACGEEKRGGGGQGGGGVGGPQHGVPDGEAGGGDLGAQGGDDGGDPAGLEDGGAGADAGGADPNGDADGDADGAGAGAGQAAGDGDGGEDPGPVLPIDDGTVEGDDCDLNDPDACGEQFGCAPGPRPICVPSARQAQACDDDAGCPNGEVCHELYKRLDPNSDQGRCLSPRPVGGWCFRPEECRAGTACENTGDGFAVCAVPSDAE